MARSAANLAMSLFSRYSAWRRTHPMSGGVARVRLDRVDAFLPLRKATFGFELAPLPCSLRLPDAEISRVQGKRSEPALTPLSKHRSTPQD